MSWGLGVLRARRFGAETTQQLDFNRDSGETPVYVYGTRLNNHFEVNFRHLIL